MCFGGALATDPRRGWQVSGLPCAARGGSEGLSATELLSKQTSRPELTVGSRGQSDMPPTRGTQAGAGRRVGRREQCLSSVHAGARNQRLAGPPSDVSPPSHGLSCCCLPVTSRAALDLSTAGLVFLILMVADFSDSPTHIFLGKDRSSRGIPSVPKLQAK